MRLYRVNVDGRTALAAEEDGTLVALAELPASLRSLAGAVAFDPGAAVAGDRLGPPDNLELLAPIRPGKIVAIGLNYQSHRDEAEMPAPATPLVFAKFTTSVIGPRDAIVVDRSITQQVDWEVELAVVVGAHMRRVAAADALAHVAAYTVSSDVSARDVQFSDGQFVRAKSLDTFCPLGPCLVTADEFGDPQAKRLRTLVNGEAVQDSNTSLMATPVAELLAFCSTNFTLEPGDLLLTGTPSGCGYFATPQRGLQAGDLLESEIEGIGTVHNYVTDLVSV
jgi:5-carboxymethyl-2-hydroxymuconate isomerase